MTIRTIPPADFELLAIEQDVLTYASEAAPVRALLAGVCRAQTELKDEPRWAELRGSWDLLCSRWASVEQRVLAVRATSPEGLRVKERVGEWLRLHRAPGLDDASFSQRVVNSMRDDAVAMALT